MSILDEIVAVNDGVQPVLVRDLRASDWIPVASALAAHQAIKDNFEPGAVAVDTTLGAPLGKNAAISVGASLSALVDVQRILVDQQSQDIRFRETSDAVLDSGIKKGSKVIIRIVNNNERVNSMEVIARNRLVEDGPIALTFDKFSVQSVSLPDEERFQISETFGGNYIYGFGRRPQTLRLSGVILNGSADVRVRGELRSMDWSNAFLRLYEDHYRLTPSIRRGKLVVVYCQDTIYTGYLLSLLPSVTVEPQNMMNVSLSMILKSRVWTNNQDRFIPGTQFAGGLYLPGKETPRDYFSEARLAAYFEGDYGQVQDLARKQALDGFNEAARQSLDAIGAAGATVDQVREAVAAALTLQAQVALARQDLYFEPALGLEFDRIYLAPAYVMLEMVERYKRIKLAVKAREDAWVETYNRGGGFKLTAALALNSAAVKEYASIGVDSSRIEVELVRAREKQSRLNSVAATLRRMYSRMQDLEAK